MTSLNGGSALSTTPTTTDSGGSGATAELQTALDTVKAAGYVVLKEKSYRQAQERQRVAEALRADAVDEAECARSWARDCLAEERRMRDRVTFLYGAARAKGATVEELAKGLTNAE